MDLQRKQLMLEAGDSLLLLGPTAKTPALIRIINNLNTWQDFTHIEPEHMVFTPLVSTPLYAHLAPVDLEPATRRLLGVNPQAMWHPLMWLPAKTAGRLELIGEHDEQFIESNELWALRVMIEIADSGLYDRDSGTWVDVLSLHNIDIDDLDNYDRISRWLDGAPDPVLDEISLDGALGTDPQWSAQLAIDILPLATRTSWSELAADFLQAVNDMADQPPADLAAITDKAMLLIGEAPLEGDLTLGKHLGELGKLLHDLSTPAEVDMAVASATEALSQVHEDHKHSRELLTQVLGSGNSQDDQSPSSVERLADF